MAIIFETERLVVREWQPDEDADAAYAIYSDWEVMRWLGREPKVAASIDEVRNNLIKNTQLARERADGTGHWPMVSKETGEIVGAVLLKQLPDGDNNPTGDYEVGWHLKRSEWGKGYATEAARAAAQKGFSELGLPVIYAVVYPENGRSIAVTQRLGMTHKGQTDKYYGVTVELFELRRGD